MNCTAAYIPYNKTGRFSNLVIDYIEGDPTLDPFISFRPTLDGITSAIREKNFPTEYRNLLGDQLVDQYKSVSRAEKVLSNISSIKKENTFTVCTAHQPNLFTGPLYFIYKIIHVIRLAEYLNEALPDFHFVPVYYMGSEDADLEELGHVVVDGKKYIWNTNQKGAVGRMKVDEELIGLIAKIKGQLLVEPFGREILSLLESCYTPGITIEDATFRMVHTLFGKYGLVVLLPDNRKLKELFIPVVQQELKEQFSNREISEVIKAFPENYKIQVEGRDINLFYLDEQTRDRIVPTKKGFAIANATLSFTKDELLELVKAEPEKISPNVVLRPVYQELILPNIIFVGGGSELAYWLELKSVFKTVGLSMPVLVMRNSFSVVSKQQMELAGKLGLSPGEFFQSKEVALKKIIMANTSVKLTFPEEIVQLEELYEKLSSHAVAVDETLEVHVAALLKNAVSRIHKLEKKMYRSEKLRHEARQRQLDKFFSSQFPKGSLQERVDNLLFYYSKWSEDFIENILKFSKALDQEYCLLIEE